MSSARSSCWASRGSTATTSTGSRAGRPRAAVASWSGPGPTVRPRDLTPAPANVRTRVHEYGGGSYVVAGGIVVYSDFSDGRLYRLDPGAEEAGRRSPRPVRGATPTCGPTCRAAGSTPSARTTASVGRRTPTARSWRSRSMAASRPSSSRAPTSSPRPGCRPTASVWPGSNGTTPTCRGTRPGCGSPRSGRTARSASRAWPPAVPTSRSSSPSGPPMGRSISSATGPAGGTCTGWSRGRDSSRSPRWRPSSPIRPGSSGARRTGSPRTAPSSPWPAPRAATTSTGSSPGTCSVRSRCRSPSSTRSRSDPRAVVALAGAPTDPTVVARFDPVTLAPAGVLRRASSIVLDPATIVAPRVDRVPDDRRPDGARPLLPADEPGVRGARRRAAAARRHVARRPDLQHARPRSTSTSSS